MSRSKFPPTTIVFQRMMCDSIQDNSFLHVVQYTDFIWNPLSYSKYPKFPMILKSAGLPQPPETHDGMWIWRSAATIDGNDAVGISKIVKVTVRIHDFA